MSKFYITTPIYYVNDLPHIGHAYTTVAADILGRWHRLKGDDTFFLTGTDEHGAKICQSAEKKGVTPQALCDDNSFRFKTAWQKLNISYDDFIRTTDQKHIDTVREITKKLFDSGKIYKKKYEGVYCVACEKFLSDEDLDENKCCPDHRQKPIVHSEENYFFKLSGYTEELTKILSDETHPQHYGVYPIERRNEILGKLKKTGLDDISISRSSLDWGIPLPFDEKQTAYVWVDALINYISAIGYTEDHKKFEKYWPCNVHLMAKDILWFHSVIWPALLLGAGLPLPKKMFAHGFFTIGGQKMSKTLGNVISPDDLVEKFGVDASRYLLLSLFPFGVDGDISWQAMTERYNNDLANNLGNLVSRTFSMTEKYFAGKVPQPNSAASPLAQDIKNILDTIEGHFDRCEFHLALEKYQSAINLANRFVQNTAPWKMAKENSPELPDVIYSLLESIGLIALYLNPVMPETSSRICTLLGEEALVSDIAASVINSDSPKRFPAAARTLGQPGILFPRFEIKK